MLDQRLQRSGLNRSAPRAHDAREHGGLEHAVGRDLVRRQQIALGCMGHGVDKDAPEHVFHLSLPRVGCRAQLVAGVHG